MIVEIQPIQIWVGGENKTAEKFNLYSVLDDFETYASLCYQLLDADGQQLISGNQTINGIDYESWNNDPDANGWILNWSASQLGLILI